MPKQEELSKEDRYLGVQPPIGGWTPFIL